MNARIVDRFPLIYADGSDARLDLPAQVRAGSGCAFIDDDTLAVLQSDKNALALIDVASRRVDAVALPASAGMASTLAARGNVANGRDWRALAYLEHRLVTLGSGLAPECERMLTFDAETRIVETTELPRLYRALRRQPLLEGQDLNIVGLLPLDEHTVRLFLRGDHDGGINATFDLSWPPVGEFGEQARVLRARRWELGNIDGVPLSFIDATRADSTVVALAAARQSPVGAGRVMAVALGVVGGAAPLETMELFALLDEQGSPYLGRAEGIAADPVSPGLFWVASNADEANAPGELLRISLPAAAAP